MKHLAAAAAALLLAFPAACEKKSPPPDPAAPGSRHPGSAPDSPPEALLRALHHASQEMALDGFQFDKPDLGWPRDRGSQSASGHLRALASHGYLSDDDLPLFAPIDIANLSDSNPGESVFAKIQTRGEILVIHKNGRLSPAAATGETTWLPR